MRRWALIRTTILVLLGPRSSGGGGGGDKLYVRRLDAHTIYIYMVLKAKWLCLLLGLDLPEQAMWDG